MGIFIFGFVWVVRFWTAMLPLSLRYEPPAVVCQTNHFWSNKSSNFFFLFHPRPPPPSRHDKQPMVITRSLPVSEGDYFLPAENQMTNDHAERPQQQCVYRKADEGGVERRGYDMGGGLSSPVQGDLFHRGCVIHNPHPLGWEVGRRCHGEAISQQLGRLRAARSGADGCVRERLTVVEGARWVRCYF